MYLANQLDNEARWVQHMEGVWKGYNQFGNVWIIFGCTSLSNTFPFFSPSSLSLTACPATFNPLNFPWFFHSCKFKMYSTFFSVALFFVLVINAVLADFAVSSPEITAVCWPASYSEKKIEKYCSAKVRKSRFLGSQPRPPTISLLFLPMTRVATPCTFLYKSLDWMLTLL